MNGGCILEFEIGDRVVYPSHGSGTIVDIKDRSVLGEERTYLEVGLRASEMKVMIPVEETESIGLRKVVNEEAVEQCLELLSKEQSEMSSNWNRRFRANTEKVKTGDMFEVAEVVRNLTVRDVDRGLATTERKQLDETREILCSEISLALDIELEEAIQMVDEALAKSPDICAEEYLPQTTCADEDEESDDEDENEGSVDEDEESVDEEEEE